MVCSNASANYPFQYLQYVGMLVRIQARDHVNARDHHHAKEHDLPCSAVLSVRTQLSTFPRATMIYETATHFPLSPLPPSPFPLKKRIRHPS